MRWGSDRENEIKGFEGRRGTRVKIGWRGGFSEEFGLGFWGDVFDLSDDIECWESKDRDYS